MINIKHKFQFGGNADQINDLALKALNRDKTATSSLYDYYLLNIKEMSNVGDLASVRDSNDNEICIVKINKVEIVSFEDITEEFAKEEGDGSLENWLKIHTDYYSLQLAQIGKKLSPNTKLVCEWFCVVDI